MFELRSYQKECVESIRRYIESKDTRPGIVIAPVACGKSILIAEAARMLGEGTLVLQPSKELLEQNIGKLRALGGEATVFSASCKSKVLSGMTYATIGSVKKVVGELRGMGIRNLLIDECFSGDTEILTEKGFIRFDELEEGLKVAQFDAKNEEISFVAPIRYIKRFHDGEMISLHIKAKVDVLVTPNHEFLNRFKNKGDYNKTNIKDLKTNGDYYIPVSGYSIERDNGDLSAIERLYIATQADGNIHMVANQYTTISFSLSKERKINRLIELCKDANIPIKEVKCHNSKKETVKHKRRFMVKMPKGTTKNLWNHIKYPMSACKADKIIREASLWDGSIISDTLLYYSSTDKSQVDFFNSVAIIAGFSCYVSVQKDDRKESFKDVYRLFMKVNKTSRDTQCLKKKYIEYKGLVYCVEVDKGAIIVRNKGYTFITGNCHSGYSPEPDSEFMRFVTALKPSKIIGFTATPCRLSSVAIDRESHAVLKFLTRMRPGFFKSVIHTVQVSDMLREGFWSPLSTERWIFDGSKLTLNSNGSEYTEESVREAVEQNGVNNLILKRIMMLENRKSILVFMDSVENCETAADWINKKGNLGKAASVHGGLSKRQRDVIVEGFKSGDIRIVFNHSVLLTGFDHPELDTVIFGRPTFSFPVFYQSIGRGLRISPKKKDCLFIDCCDNSSRFGDIRSMEIKDIPGFGWGIVVGDRVITNFPMEETVMVDEIEKVKIESKLPPADRRKPGRPDIPEGEYRINFGMYKGYKLKALPNSYLSFLKEKGMAARNKNINDYVNLIRI